jgi:plasmid stability protein
MKSITLRNLDDETLKIIEQKSQESGQSYDDIIRGLLHQALGITSEKEHPPKEEYAEFFGVWDENDFREFTRNTEDTDQVNPQDWE